jgi:hypothetical protein
MRTLLFVPAVGLVAAIVGNLPVACQEEPGTVDLLAGSLKDWTRMGVGKSPWRLTADRQLVCAAANDAYVPDTEFPDGTLEFQYRFRPTGAKTGFKASVWARRTLHSAGCKMALGDDCGTLVGTFDGASDRAKEVTVKPAEPVARPIGFWNTVRVEMCGRSVRFTINGKPAGSFDQCDNERGLVFFEAEGSAIEFRRILWKPAGEPARR